MMTGRLWLVSVVLALMCTLSPQARAQCDAAASLEGYGPLGLDGDVTSMVMWDADGPSGPFPNIMAIGGTFQRAGNLSDVNGLVGWDGSAFMRLSPPSSAGAKLLCTWDQDGSGPQFPVLVEVSNDASPVVSTYNGTAWSTIGTFSGGTITAMTTWFPNRLGASNWLIIAGTDLQIGGAGPCSIVRFDGSTWSAVATVSGGGHRINSLAVWDPDGSGAVQTDCLAFGGNFDHVTTSGSTTSGYGNVGYLMYNAGTYQPSNMSGGCVGNTPVGTAEVYALAAWTVGSGPKRLVIGGIFDTAGGASNARGLVWFSTSEFSGDTYYAVEPSSSQWGAYKMVGDWDPDGAGPMSGRLVVFGWNSAYNTQAPFYAASNGAWDLIGATSYPNFNVNALGVWDAAGDHLQPNWLFIGGAHGSVPFNGVTRINTGNQWLGLPNLGPDVLASGYITSAVSVSNLATTNPSGTFIGGAMDYAGPLAVNNAANFVRPSWGGVGSGFNGAILAEAPFRSGFGVNAANTVYAGGSFTATGSTTLNHVAHLSGGPISGYTWNAMGSGLNGDAYAMLQFDPDGSGPLPSCLIVGGAFTTAGGATANHIAYWNPSAAAWGTLSAQGFNGSINAMVAWDPDGSGPLGTRLVVGGSFTTAGGVSISRLAYWDGVQWQPFEGGPINGTVNALYVWPDPANPAQPRLVVGGTFTLAGSTAANNVAVWRPSGWDTSIGAGVLGTNAGVFAITSADLDGPGAGGAGQGTELIVGGLFDHNFQGDTLSNLARWDPFAQHWTEMGTWAARVSGGPAIKLLRPWTANVDGRSTILVGGNFWRDGLPAGLMVDSTTQPFVSAAPPAQSSGCLGATVALSATALGDGLVYRWSRNGVNLNDGPSGTGSVLSGVTTATLTITGAGTADSGSYALSIANTCGGTVTTASALTVQACCGSADFNCDGDAGTDADIEAFFACLAGTCPSPPCASNADFNDDGDSATDADIEAFFRVLAGGTC